VAGPIVVNIDLTGINITLSPVPHIASTLPDKLEEPARYSYRTRIASGLTQG